MTNSMLPRHRLYALLMTVAHIAFLCTVHNVLWLLSNSLLKNLGSNTRWDTLLASIGFLSFTIGYIYFMVKFVEQEELKSYLALRNIFGYEIFCSMVCLIFMWIISFLTFSSGICPLPFGTQQDLGAVLAGVLKYYYMPLAISMLAWEISFRGFFFGLLKHNGWKDIGAFGCTSPLFCLVYVLYEVNVTSLASMFIFSTFLGYIRYKYTSLLLPILLQCVGFWLFL